MKLRPSIAYPVLAAAYPVLALASGNLGDGVTTPDLVVPLAGALLVGLAAWVAFGLLVRDVHAQALLTFLLVAWFGGFGLARDAAAVVTGSARAVPDALVLLVGISAIGAAVLWLRRQRPNLAGVTRYLSVTLLILVLFPLISGLSHSVASRPDRGPALPDEGSTQPATSGQSLPDIYLLILDAYSASSVLLERYGFDNRPFERELEARGFVVPRASRPNYGSTFLSLAALLNWRYLDDVAADQPPGSTDRRPVYRLLEDNRAVEWLQNRGYRFVFFGSAYPPLRENRNADVLYPGVTGSGFLIAWLRSTALYGVLRIQCALATCPPPRLPFAPEQAERHDQKFLSIADLPPHEGPSFVMAHFMVPHEPLVFNADCSSRESFWPGVMDEEEEAMLLEGYPEQVECVNRKVIELVDRILRKPGEPPIILLQSDHGLGGFPFGQPPPLEEVTPVQVRDRTHIFAAYHLPGGGGDEVYDSITPVNVFPLVFRRYFDADIAPLADRTYWSAWEQPYSFEPLQ